MNALESLRQRILSSKTPKQPEQAIAQAMDEAPDLVAPLILCAEHPDWIAAYYTHQKLSWKTLDQAHPLHALIMASSQHPSHEDALDQALSKNTTSTQALDALARSLTPWEHKLFKKSIANKETQLSTCAVLAMADPERLLQWSFNGPREESDVINALLALMHFDELDTELLVDVIDALRQESDGNKPNSSLSRLQSLLAAHDPLLFARGALEGEFELNWTERSEWVADVLTLHHETSWLETLAILELSNARQAFGFASILAICAATAHSVLALNDNPEKAEQHAELLDLLRAQKTWEPLATSLNLEFPLAVADEDLTPLLVEIAIHERLVQAHITSPGVMGLPLSATLDEALDIEQAKQLLKEAQDLIKPDDETLCVLVRTICDLRNLLADENPTIQNHTSELLALLEPLTTHSQRAIAMSAKRTLAQQEHYNALLAPEPESFLDAAIAGVDVPGAQTLLAKLAAREGVAALWALNELTELTLDESLPHIALAYSECHIPRAPYIKQLMEELVQEETLIL